MTDPYCPICGGEGWVCADHPHEPWPHCDAEGMACKCNPGAEMPPGTAIIASTDDEKETKH